MTSNIRQIIICATTLFFSNCIGNNPPGNIEVAWTLGFGVECDDQSANIDTIRAKVFLPSKNTPIAEHVFTCSEYEALIPDIPVGIYNLELEGGIGENFTTPVFKGSVGSIAVISKFTTNTKNIVLEKVPPIQTPGTLKISWTFKEGLCGANNVANVHLLIWRDLVYKEHDHTYPCDLPSPGYLLFDLSSGKYGVIAEAMSEDERLMRYASDDNVKISEGETTTLAFVLDFITN